MASSSGCLLFELSRPHFFKVVLGETIRDRKICIPRKFARKYGNDLANRVVLKVPSGAKWQVEIEKCGGEIWLNNGLQEFMEYYSIALGSFLVFAYDQENYCFDVIIFDHSASEIEYPFSLINENSKAPNLEKESQEPEIQETEDDESVEILSHQSEDVDSVEILETSPPCQKTQDSPVPFTQPQKKIKLQNSTRKVKEGDGGISNRRSKMKRDVSEERLLTSKEKANAIQRARTQFKSENPFFMVLMTLSYVAPRYDWVIVPAQFSKKHLPEKYCNATLIVLEGRTQSVEYNIQISYKKEKSRRICHGWKKFAKDNHLEMGDICAFELISTANTTFKVTIFRNIQPETCCSSFGNKKQLNRRSPSSRSTPSRASEAAKGFTPTTSFFRVIITSRHLKKNDLYVPKEFLAAYTKPGTDNLSLMVEDVHWPVKIKTWPPFNYGKLCDGWLIFARGNSLQVGDICIFEQINGETELIKVSIFRHAD